ncbi:hypothetical protein [Leptospira idonii]|uniref:Uncharacterized protein n=1 Tax=Leptospira idonii TaxID=1193500 RepID=A0A4R9M2R8_9LEPT|nr:hypothetical protein [Leptospira idonii]TGN20281.1 hypothetical protein EHS15_03425 [Leptospira idonii]
MLSLDPHNLSPESSVVPSKNLSKKLETFTNNLLFSMHSKEEQERTWAVVTLKGEILASGVPQYLPENDYLFKEG